MAKKASVNEFKSLDLEREPFTFFKFEEEGETITGTIEKTIFLFDKEKGEKVERFLIREEDEGLLCLPNHGGLNYALRKAQELNAEMVQITYEGLVKVEGKKHKMHNYKIRYK